MKNFNLVFIFSAIVLIGFGGLYSFADDDDDDDDRYEEYEHGEHFWERMFRRNGPRTVQNETYQAECGACHFAYQAGLLPASAWTQIMGDLENHYGDDASLDQQTSDEISAYLQENASGRGGRISKSFSRSGSKGGGLPRITGTRYFRSEHHEIPRRFVEDNPEVGSFSQCQACHRNADKGDYDEHGVVIPGYGRWDD